jgi:hypothetical protein
MAEDDKAEKGDDAPALSVQGVTAPPREKPLIEGAAIKAETSNNASPVDDQADISADRAGDVTPVAALDAPIAHEAEAPAKDIHADRDKAAAPLRRRTGLKPAFVAILIGAVVAILGAFALHVFDQPPKTLSALEARVAALEQGGETFGALQAGAAALGKRIDALEKETQVTHAGLAHMQQNFEQLENSLRQLAQKTSTQTPGGGGLPAADLVPLSGRIDQLERDFTGLDQRLAALAAKFDAEVRELQSEKDLQAEKTAAAQTAVTHAEAAALAILAGNLRRKLEAGEAFGDDLTALANHGVDKGKLAPLEALAAAGVATPAALAKQFAALTPAILASQPERKAEGFFNRLVQEASGLVHIRKIGDTNSNDLAGEVARIAAALAAGKLEEAWREWNDLPAEAKGKSQAFGDLLQHRIAARAAANSIEAEALAVLAKVKS